jgi:hypothetical protein
MFQPGDGVRTNDLGAQHTNNKPEKITKMSNKDLFLFIAFPPFSKLNNQNCQILNGNL